MQLFFQRRTSLVTAHVWEMEAKWFKHAQHGWQEIEHQQKQKPTEQFWNNNHIQIKIYWNLQENSPNSKLKLALICMLLYIHTCELCRSTISSDQSFNRKPSLMSLIFNSSNARISHITINRFCRYEILQWIHHILSRMVRNLQITENQSCVSNRSWIKFANNHFTTGTYLKVKPLKVTCLNMAERFYSKFIKKGKGMNGGST